MSRCRSLSAFRSQHPAVLRFTFHFSRLTSHACWLLIAAAVFAMMQPCADPAPSILSPASLGLARRLGIESNLLDSRLQRDWVSIVGEPIASNTWPDQIRYKKLYLLVHNSVWLHQLTFLKPTLIQKINSVAGGELVTEMVLRVGEIPLRAAASATTPSLDGDVTVSEIALAEVSSHVSVIQDPGLRLLFTSVISRYPQALSPPGWGPSRVL